MTIKSPFTFLKTMQGFLLMFFAAFNANAATFSVLYDFPVGSGQPLAGLTVSSNLLYGVQLGGGVNHQGSIFSITTNGYPLTNYFSFTTNNNSANGASPAGTLLLSGNTLYGTTSSSGSNYGGTVFRINLDGSSFTNLHIFSPSTYGDGGDPYSALVLSGNMLYGTTKVGGYGAGAVFGVSTDGTVFTNLHSFVNSDGANPLAGLAISGQMLFGTTSAGGVIQEGTVFRINTDGTGFTNIHTFTAAVDSGSAFTNADGATPWFGSLLLVGNKLFGTCQDGGVNGNGTIFAINTDGTGFTNCHSFTATSYNAGVGYGTNTDGMSPYSGLALYGNKLYGSTTEGGSFGSGTIYAINTDGTGFTNLYSIAREVYNNGYINSDGYLIYGSLVPLGNTLYGTAYLGGPYGRGTVFSLTVPPAPAVLNCQFTAGNLNLSWSDASYALYIAPKPGGPYVKLLGAVSPYAVGVTNPQQFFRLSQQ